MQRIVSFQGPYRFLSNFYSAKVLLDGEVYPTVEHAYQAAKTLDPGLRASIRLAAFPGLAKQRGRSLRVRSDWELVKLQVMEGLLRQKFADPDMRRRLAATASMELIEGNTWGDTYWGQCPIGVGHNHLGKLLMAVRGTI